MYLQANLQDFMKAVEKINGALAELDKGVSEEDLKKYWSEAFGLVADLHGAFHMVERWAIEARIWDYVTRGLGYPTRLGPTLRHQPLSTSGS